MAHLRKKTLKEENFNHTDFLAKSFINISDKPDVATVIFFLINTPLRNIPIVHGGVYGRFGNSISIPKFVRCEKYKRDRIRKYCNKILSLRTCTVLNGLTHILRIGVVKC